MKALFAAYDAYLTETSKPEDEQVALDKQILTYEFYFYENDYGFNVKEQAQAITEYYIDQTALFACAVLVGKYKEEAQNQFLLEVLKLDLQKDDDANVTDFDDIESDAVEALKDTGLQSKTPTPGAGRSLSAEEIEKRQKYFQNYKPVNKRNLSEETEGPFFIVGFPRSGTTLLDTILRSHPSIEVLEEIPIINRFIDHLYIKKGFTLEDLENIDPKSIKEMRDYYFNQIENYKKNKNKKITIDKMPLNIVHVGEILRFFPNAKFILCLRHPNDCVLSCFMQNFMLNHAMANFLNLDDSLKLYDLTMSLWKNYNNVFKIDSHITKYEDVISNFEKTIRDLLKFLNVKWSDNVTEFHKTAEKRGIINTPSYNQVNQPIYTNSMYRWKNYKKEFDKSNISLENWIKEFNY